MKKYANHSNLRRKIFVSLLVSHIFSRCLENSEMSVSHLKLDEQAEKHIGLGYLWRRAAGDKTSPSKSLDVFSEERDDLHVSSFYSRCQAEPKWSWACLNTSRHFPHCDNDTSYHLGFVSLGKVNYSLFPSLYKSECNPCIHCIKNQILFAWFYITPLLIHMWITVFSGRLISDKQGNCPTLQSTGFAVIF